MTEAIEGLKQCPFCGEEILSVAIKCKHCGEILDKQQISTPKNENIALAMLAIPIIATLLCWFWIGSMNLFQQPGSKLNFLMIAVIISTAILAAYEASKLGIGQENDLVQKGKRKSGSVQWFFFVALLWIVGYPYYLYQRKKYGMKSYLVSSILVALIFTGTFYSMGTAINDKVSEVQQTFKSFG